MLILKMLEILEMTRPNSLLSAQLSYTKRNVVNTTRLKSKKSKKKFRSSACKEEKRLSKLRERIW